MVALRRFCGPPTITRVIWKTKAQSLDTVLILSDPRICWVKLAGAFLRLMGLKTCKLLAQFQTKLPPPDVHIVTGNFGVRVALQYKLNKVDPF